jgi:hypothetical protein
MFTKLEDRLKYVPDAKDTNVTRCPGIAARNWYQDAYSPRTGLVYTAASNPCGAQKMVEGKFVPGTDYTLRETVGQNPLAPLARPTQGNCRPTIRSLARRSGAFRGRWLCTTGM